MDRIFTAKEVSKLFNCSLTFVYDHVNELGGVKIGTLIRFPESKLKGILDVNVEDGPEMVLPLQAPGPVGNEPKGIRHPGRRQIRASKKEGRTQQNPSDEFGLRRAVRISTERFEVKKGSLVSVR
jgi:excisionase family DNA binding protein